ncbi:MAG: dihydropteroate synthase [Cyanobacteria bacterium]|nr:dihydropteroate synthase [Cyanobacteriota bacterium]
MPVFQLMQVLNLTPDSFSDGGAWLQEDGLKLDGLCQAVENSLKMGVNHFDLGAESTRPGALPVSSEVQLSRLIPAIEALQSRFPEARLSVDTRSAQVAKAACEREVWMINDVSAGRFDPAMLETVADFKNTQLVLMHSQGTPEMMQDNPCYENVLQEVRDELTRQTQLAVENGVSDTNIWWDPGFGFGKRESHNLELLRDWPRIDPARTRSWVLGLSRKSFLTLPESAAKTSFASVVHAEFERDPLTAAGMALAVSGLLTEPGQNLAGRVLFRVHAITTLLPVLRLLEAVCEPVVVTPLTQ